MTTAYGIPVVERIQILVTRPHRFDHGNAIRRMLEVAAGIYATKEIHARQSLVLLRKIAAKANENRDTNQVTQPSRVV